VIRGGGDLASGIAARLFRSGFKVIMTELPKPLTVRRTVSFSEAIYSGFTEVERIISRRSSSIKEISITQMGREIPILVDENLEILKSNKYEFSVLIDARMEKKPEIKSLYKSVPLLIGIGPGFTAGVDCSVVIESSRGHSLGRIYRQGKALDDTGHPAGDPTRILRAPMSGTILTEVKIGDLLESGSVIAKINGVPILAPFTGLLRGLIHDGVTVQKGMKIGDMDHRSDINLCFSISDKAMAIGGSVLEVILSDTNLQPDRRDKPKL